MKCEVCKSPDHRVVDVADSGNSIRRRRECDRCKTRWTTFESCERLDTVDIPAALEHLRALEAVLGRSE